jgi:hypothetical protein
VAANHLGHESIFPRKPDPRPRDLSDLLDSVLSIFSSERVYARGSFECFQSCSIGAVLSGFLPAVTLLGQGNHALASLALYLICAVVHFSVANFVTPKVLGSKVDINATTSTIALIAWGELWGGFGLILAIPMTAAIKIVFQYSGSEWLRWIAALMSENVDAALETKTEKAIATPEPS